MYACMYPYRDTNRLHMAQYCARTFINTYIMSQTSIYMCIDLHKCAWNAYIHKISGIYLIQIPHPSPFLLIPSIIITPSAWVTIVWSVLVLYTTLLLQLWFLLLQQPCVHTMRHLILIASPSLLILFITASARVTITGAVISTV
jgi:hypothetical protein